MAVITRFIVVRNGVELDKVFEERKEADAYDKMLDAADNLAAFIRQGDLQIDLDANTIDAVSIYLAKNAPEVTRILKGLKPMPPVEPVGTKSQRSADPDAAEDKKTPGRKPGAKIKEK